MKCVIVKMLSFVLIFALVVPVGFGSAELACVDEGDSEVAAESFEYYSYSFLDFRKIFYPDGLYLDSYGNAHAGGLVLYLNCSELDEVFISFHFNCSASMNYSTRFPYVFFAPIAVFGFMIENHTDYVWRCVRLQRNGCANWSSEICLNVTLDLDGVVSGTEGSLVQNIVYFGDPFLFYDPVLPRSIPTYNLYFRLLFNLREVFPDLFFDWIHTFVVPYNMYEYDVPRIFYI